MIITRVSQFSGIEREMDLPISQDQLDRIDSGELIQNVLPNLSEDDREFLLTGATPEEWDDAFSDKELDFNDDDEVAF